MRQNVKIVGIDKKRIQGEKNGFRYDFLIHHVVYTDPAVSGFHAAAVGISNDDSASFGQLSIGKTYDMVFHFGKNGRMIIDSVLGAVEDK